MCIWEWDNFTLVVPTKSSSNQVMQVYIKSKQKHNKNGCSGACSPYEKYNYRKMGFVRELSQDMRTKITETGPLKNPLEHQSVAAALSVRTFNSISM